METQYPICRQCGQTDQRGRLYKALTDLVSALKDIEDIEHDFFGCEDKEDCALCAAKKLLAELDPDFQKQEREKQDGYALPDHPTTFG